MKTRRIPLLARLTLLGLFPLAVFSPGAAAQLSTEGWSHWEADASVAPHVSVGDHGGQVFAHVPVDCCGEPTRALLLTANEVGPPGPVAWTVQPRRDVPWDVDSADHDDVHVSITTREPTPSGTYEVWVHRWSSASKKPTWSRPIGTWTSGTPLGWSTGRPRIRCSHDGALIVAMVERPGAGGAHDVLVLDGPTGAVLSTVPVPAPVSAPPEPAPRLTSFDLSGDGTVAVWRLGRGGYALDVDSGQLLLALDDGGALYTGGSIAVSGDGGVVALADSVPGKARLYVRASPGAAYQLLHEHQGMPEAWSGAVVDVSDDGTVVAVGYGGFNFPGIWIWVEALDVASGVQTMTDVTGYPNIGYGVTDLALSADGQRFVVGVSGGQDFDADRVLLYAPDQNDPLWTANPLTGDVADVDISEDGRVVAIGARYLEGPGATVWMLPVEPSADFVVTGLPAIGAPLGFELAGGPGRLAYLLAAAGPADPPIALGGGTLWLDPATLRLLPMGVVSPAGSAQLSVTLPPDPALIGAEVWTQGLTLPGETFTESWRKLTVLP